MNNLGEYYDFYVQYNTLLSADVLRTFEMAEYFTTSGLA